MRLSKLELFAETKKQNPTIAWFFQNTKKDNALSGKKENMNQKQNKNKTKSDKLSYEKQSDLFNRIFHPTLKDKTLFWLIDMEAKEKEEQN